MEFKDPRAYQEDLEHLGLRAILECQGLEECLVILGFQDCLDFR